MDNRQIIKHEINENTKKEEFAFGKIYVIFDVENKIKY